MKKQSHIHKKADSSASNPVRSQLQSRPFIAQAKPQSEKPLFQTQTENQEFQQQKFEATKLEIQAKYGTITPEGQERLTVLQGKMSGSLHTRLEHASSFGHNFANIAISRPDAPSQLAIQTKLTIGEPGDKYEQEADRVAAQVVNQINAPVSGQAGQSHPVQREEVSEKERELQMKPMLQLRSTKVGMTAAPEVEASIKQARGGGQSLAKSIREPMEQAIGADFSRVKVHTDSRANQLNQSIQAKAFTTGQDVFFRQGEYNPGSLGGKKLLAHELTHVVQQNGSTVQRKEQSTDFLVSKQPAAKMPTSTRSETENLQPFGAKETADLDVIQCVQFSKALPGNLKFSKKRGLKIGSQRETEQIAEEQEVETEQEQALRRVSDASSRAVGSENAEEVVNEDLQGIKDVETQYLTNLSKLQDKIFDAIRNNDKEAIKNSKLILDRVSELHKEKLLGKNINIDLPAAKASHQKVNSEVEKLKRDVEQRNDTKRDSQPGSSNTKAKPINERREVTLAMGQGVVAALGEVVLSSNSFSSCSPIVMFNAGSQKGALIHFPARDIKTMSAYLKSMYEKVQPTEIYINERTALNKTGFTLQVDTEKDPKELTSFFQDECKFSGRIKRIDKESSEYSVTLGEDGNVMIVGEQILTSETIDARNEGGEEEINQIKANLSRIPGGGAELFGEDMWTRDFGR
ncbi:eCIS core domain-containing protein [Nostoc sp.]|uniref:eCIS core domain-containing protein n=1 Tax=Nostoc sp. TaxID=1180 RepID=UPI002FFCB9E7